ncbi:DNA alkylation repair protein [Aureibaculum sp. 2210JD6-5]|uniref:DNA alkylation repair protein n=1 Tax=Aureibaculum sp. 2210JD6-5 TaxID=3103957 RepID=UPI002AAD8B6F|nr:DNA alkylation repair protein [Aureibaculum sp. 2210JD6-5]MDY7393789.1 DNA alkylation repair protein [Aureibaculum sp. 2210JD6-5]
MENNKSITEHFGTSLAILLSDKIKEVYPEFNSENFIKSVDAGVVDKSYTKRIIYIAEQLHQQLPKDFEEAIRILVSILGDENLEETGMFTNYWWVMPIGKFVELYGIDHYELSINAIAEITKRNTGEYAIRPFIRKYPEKCLKQMKEWALSDNFHLRRLASEGLRPKLPWSTKLDTFNDRPEPVFEILELLKEDEIMFVKKSVGNHLTDWLKVNPEPTKNLIRKWRKSDNKHTQWIIKRATRKIKV